MSTSYVGYRNVLQGQNSNNWVGPRGNIGVYSNYSLRNTGNKILTGFPDRQYVLGTYKQARLLEYLFAGGQHVAPLKDPGNGPRLAGARYRPLENKSAGNARAFPDGFGHLPRTTTYSLYSNFTFHGVPSAQTITNEGHVRRFNATYGGAFDPYVNKGVMPQALATAVDNPYPTGYNNPYGKNRPGEWRGVPSSRRL